MTVMLMLASFPVMIAPGTIQSAAVGMDPSEPVTHAAHYPQQCHVWDKECP